MIPNALRLYEICEGVSLIVLYYYYYNNNNNNNNNNKRTLYDINNRSGYFNLLCISPRTTHTWGVVIFFFGKLGSSH